MVCKGDERERERERERESKRAREDTGLGRTQLDNSDKLYIVSIFIPLFQLKVPPRLGGPPICPSPYAPAYPDATPLIRFWNVSHLQHTLQTLMHKRGYVLQISTNL